MTEWHGWTLSRKETKEWLAECQKRRLKEGKAWKAEARERVALLEGSGREWEAEQASMTLHRRSVIFARRNRQRQEAELERDMRRVGAAVRKSERDLDRARQYGTAPLFEFEPGRASQRVREGRDLYWEWISRGFGKRKARDYKKSKSPRIRAREAKWKDGEFQDKIVYIERVDALEEVQGNLISNMGAEQAERIGCADRIEEIERLSRKDASVYVHSILALPAELSPEGRAKLLNDLCSNLARMRLPFAAALHKPDPKNDQRNFHAHILVSLRPFERLEDKWEFAATKSTWLSTPGGLKLQRRVIARAFNKALEAERATARWTHRSRAADGLAPGGFTKKGGVSGGSPKLPEDVEEVVLASAMVEESIALERAVGALDRLATRLHASEQLHERLEQRADERAAQREAAVEEISQTTVPDSASATALGISEAPVASSQHPKSVAADNENERSLEVTGVEKEEGQESSSDEKKDPVSVPPEVHALAFGPPMPPRVSRRWGKLRRAAEKIRKKNLLGQLEAEKRAELSLVLNKVVLDLAFGRIVIRSTGQGLGISGGDEQRTKGVVHVASSQPAWQAIVQLADSISELAPRHHHNPIHVTDPADDWILQYDPNSKGAGR